MALYQGQAMLIKRLAEQSAALAKSGTIFEIGTPDEFRQREADIVLLSLVRSHTHRPVAFGDRPELMALALTRARRKILIFGDLGTVVRRSTWEGPLEHLDEVASSKEREIIARLVHYIEGQGCVSEANHPCQGSGS